MMEEKLTSLRDDHPRLLPAGRIARIKELIDTDQNAQRFFDHLLLQGTSLLNEPPAEKVLVGREAHYMYMLLTSRKVLDRVYTLTLLYLLTGEGRWKDRVVAELLNAARYENWNPAHWLDVAEMIHAFSVGYDFLYDALSVAEREEITRAVVEKGLMEAVRGFEIGLWWTKDRYNWNNVCNGGIIIGALVFAEAIPQHAAWLVESAVENVKVALDSYSPDGAWAEGPAYWGYATRYSISAFDALQNVLGHDFGLGSMPGLAEAGWSRLHGVGPSGYFFNFADARPGAPFDPSLLWLARRYQTPAFARAALDAYSQNTAEPDFGSDARALLWYEPVPSADVDLQGGTAGLPLDVHYQRVHLAFLRSSWQDSDAIYVGFKGGDNKVNHSHVDLGTFVVDALGVRWLEELGGDEYTMPGYWEKQPGGRRWSYYRLSTFGHNTVVINGKNQSPFAEAPILDFQSRPGEASVTADLTQGYVEEGAEQMIRTISLANNRSLVRIVDEVHLTKPGIITWQVHTSAEVELHGPRAVLRQGDRRMEMVIESPEGAYFRVYPIQLDPPQIPADGVKRLAAEVSDTRARFQVTCSFRKGQTE